MNARSIRLAAIGCLIFCLLSASARAQKLLLFEKSEYAARRARLMERIPDGALILLGATLPTGGEFFQNNERLGVRVEDTVLITETGCENLTPGLRRTVAEIEAFFK